MSARHARARGAAPAVRSGRRAAALTRRRAGVLLHPTALAPAGDASREAAAGTGSLGAAARALVDWLAQARFSVWQMLPLGPVGANGSPYWARSDFAGEPALIDRGELPDLEAQRRDYEAFCAASAAWLDSYVLYEVLTRRLPGPWWQWPSPLRDRDPDALQRFSSEHAQELEQRRIDQWYFDWQWRALRRYASDRGVLLFGDLPIYVAPDSVSTWLEPEQFQLDEEGRPQELAGVPPDYFSADGQLWGNPLYDWGQAEKDGFAFWRARLAQQLRRFDLVRVDHFRGLLAYWSVPAGAATAREGRWCPAPGAALLRALRSAHPTLPLVAEDLGLITPDVVTLREQFGLPGMRVLQFGFDGALDNPHLPHNYERKLVAYTGTHDNDTTAGWYRSLGVETAQRVDFYLRSDAASVAQAMGRAVLGSVAQLAMLPVQDLLQLGSEARFNTPGTTRGNWSWRLPAGALTEKLAEQYAALNRAFDRERSGDPGPLSVP